MGINIVDRDKLDAALTATANAIRYKTGGSESIPFDMSTMTGFKEAVDAIPSGEQKDWVTPIITRTISESYTNPDVLLIGNNAFASCVSLPEVSFAACKSISTYGFSGCTTMVSANFPECTYIETGAFSLCRRLKNINFPKLESVGGGAFYGCSDLANVSFPACVYIGSSAFISCRSLNTVNAPICEYVYDYTFSYCSKLTNVNLPKLRYIGSNAFYSCASLETISLPACESIGSFAFAKCYHLLSLYVLGSSVPRMMANNVFSSTPISTYTTSTGGVRGSIIVQESMLSAFLSAVNWSIFSSRFSVWNGID